MNANHISLHSHQKWCHSDSIIMFIKRLKNTSAGYYADWKNIFYKIDNGCEGFHIKPTYHIECLNSVKDKALVLFNTHINNLFFLLLWLLNLR